MGSNAQVPRIPKDDWVRLNRVIRQLSFSVYGPDSSPTFNGLNLTGDLAIGGDATIGGDLTVVGTVLGGTITDGTASLAGGVGTGYTLTAPDINGGTVDTITSLTVANNVDIGNYTLTANGLTIDGTFTDGTASLAGGILGPVTLSSPWELAGDGEWSGAVAELFLVDTKIINLNTGGLTLQTQAGHNFVVLNSGSNSITLSNASTDAPVTMLGDGAFAKAGTGLISTGGAITATGIITGTGGGRFDAIGPLDTTNDTLIQLATDSVTISGDIVASGNSSLSYVAGKQLGLGTDSPSATYKAHIERKASGDPTRTLLVEHIASTTNAIASSMTFKSTSTGDMADGFGPGFLYAIEDVEGIERFIGRMSFYRDGHDRSGKFELATYNAGSRKVAMTIDSNQITRIGDGGTTDYSEFEADGTLKFKEAATVWQDVQFSLSTAKVPAANFPAWAAFGANTNKFTFGEGDYVDLEANEISHSYKEGSDMTWHVHIYNNGLDVTSRTVNYQLDFGITNVNGVYSESSQALEVTIPANTPDKTHLIYDLYVVTGTNIDHGSDITVRFSRIANVGTDPSGDPFVSMVGLHIENDTVGSRQILVK